MNFQAKIDSFYVNFIMIIIFILWLTCSWPLLLLDNKDWFAFLLLVSVFLISAGFLLWELFSIRYTFYPEYLLVRGGPFRSRIPYDKITKVTSSTNIFSGYRVLSSKDAIEIFYKQAIWGSVTISPELNKEFIHELKSRCSNIQIRE